MIATLEADPAIKGSLPVLDRGRSPLWSHSCRACMIDRHESHGPGLLPELPSAPGASGCPGGGTRRPQAGRRPAGPATRRGPQGLLDLLQAPSSDIVKPPRPPPPEGQDRRRIGGQPGHPKHERAAFPPEAINGGSFDHRLDCCPGCGHDLQPAPTIAPRVVQQVDIAEVPALDPGAPQSSRRGARTAG